MDQDTNNSDSQIVEAKTSEVNLPAGEAMQPSDTAHIVGSRKTRIVVLAGAADSGKSTLIASLYERFSRGPFAGFNFAGSETLVAFERMCHLSRGTSGNKQADIERTKQLEGHKMLHLRLADDTSFHDLLLTDISGEEFEAAVASRAVAKNLVLLRRADRVVLMVDGHKIVDPMRRHEAIEDARHILKAFVDVELFNKSTLVDVLISKDDLVSIAPPEAQCDRAIARLEEAMRSYAYSRLGQVMFGRVAARGVSGDLVFARGLEPFVRGWVDNSPLDQRERFRFQSQATLVEADRFLARRIPERVEL